MENLNLPIIVFLSSFTAMTLTACGGESSSTGSTSTTPQSNPNISTIQKTATIIDEKSNIAVYGPVNKNYFSNTTFKSGTGVLLLDDNQVNVVGFGVDLKNQNTTLDALSKKYLDEFTKLLKDNQAQVNVLVNKVSSNTQGEVANITLDVDFPNDTSVQNVRSILLNYLNFASNVSTPTVVNTQNKKIRINLSFWVANNTGFVWATTYTSLQTDSVNKVYGDINVGTALTNNINAEIHKNTESFTQNVKGSNAVDILWTIDSSGSMGEEQKNLANGASQFFKSLNQAGINYRLGVNTHDANECKSLRTLTDGKTTFISPTTLNAEDEWKKLSQPGTRGSGDEYGFYCNKNVDLTTFDRPDAKNISVFLSDEPENEIFYQDAPTYAQKAVDYNTYEKYFLSTGTTYFAISGTANYLRNDFNATKYPTPADTNWKCSGDGGNAEGGAEFKQIAKLTGGSWASICSDATSWNVMFDEIIKAASGLASSFNLAHVPIPSTVEVKKSGVSVIRDTSHQNGFDIIVNSKGASIVFYGKEIPQAQEKIDVTYSYLKQ